MNPHDIEVSKWILVQHEEPQKFESKWFGPYQTVEKMLLGTYGLQDPSGRELASLVRGNRLQKVRISYADDLSKLWSAPAIQYQLRRLNLSPEPMSSKGERNNKLLGQYLMDTDDALLEDTTLMRTRTESVS